MFVTIAAASLIALAGAASPAQPVAKAQPAKTEAKAPQTEAQAKFERLKKLAGVWQSEKGPDGNQASTIYRVTGAGSAVTETLLPGTEHEMVTVYTMDGDSILCTHYCAAGNAPRMQSKPGAASNVIAFEFRDCSNLKSANDGHMHSLTLTFKDDDHIAAAWQYYVNGKPSDEHAPVFEMTRVKDADAAAKIITTAATASCCSASGATCCESGVKAKGTN